MISTHDRKYLLPPPVSIILLYAADGLAMRLGRLKPSGKPRTPGPIEWAADFRKLVDSPEGRDALKALAIEGMKACGCSAVELDCLGAAFRDVRFQALATTVLENFADTARPRFSLTSQPADPVSFPRPAGNQPPAADTRPRLERPLPRKQQKIGPRFIP